MGEQERFHRVQEQVIGDTRIQIVEDTQTGIQYALSGGHLTRLDAAGGQTLETACVTETVSNTGKKGNKIYWTEVIDYSPKAKDMARLVEDKCNEMAGKGLGLVTMSVMPSAKAILVFEQRPMYGGTNHVPDKT